VEGCPATRSRRVFLRRAVTLAGAVLLQACGGTPAAAPKPTEPVKQTGALPTTVVQSAPTAVATTAPAPAATVAAAPAAAGRPAGKLAGDIQVWAGTNYQPSDSMEKSPQNLQPHDAVIRIGNEYKKLHPEVGKIDWIKVPTATDARLWTETSQAGGTIPHISWQHSFQIDNDVRKDWWLPLDDFVKEPNPYIQEGPGSKAWIDQFFEIPTGTKKSIDGHLYVIPYDLITTFFYFNKELFTRAGIADVPKTWVEYEKVQQALKDRGITPNGTIAWVDTQIAQMVFSSLEEKVHPGGGPVLRKEVACAIKNKVWDFETPMAADYLRILKSMVPFHDPDWASTAVTFDAWRQKFKTGQIAIYEYHTQLYGLLKADPEFKFEWGAFYCPTITKETSQFSTGRAAPPIGGATSTQLAVTTRARKEDRVALAVDLLQYLSVPANATLMIGELGNRLPNIKGVNVAEDLRGPLNAISNGYGEAAMFVYGDKVSQEVNKKRADAIKLMRLGKASIEETQKEIQRVQTEGALDDIKQNGWNC
jgi:ABC-type glycerol-3-phosphate transport system substrate-binding protein